MRKLVLKQCRYDGIRTLSCLISAPSFVRRFANNGETPKMTREASSATFHGWKDVDLIVRSNEIEVDEDDLNEGFCHYSIINDDE